MKPLPFTVLKGYLYVEAFLYRLHVPSGFGGRYGSDKKIGHVFPQGLLVAFTLVGSGAKDRLLTCSVAITTLSGMGSDHKLLEQKF